MQRALAALRPPAGYVQWLDAGAAAARLGLAPRRGGLWFADGAIVDGAAWCAALLAAQADRIHLRRHARVEAIAWHDGQWRARGPWGEAAAPLLVVATALDAARLLDLPGARLRAVRGRLSLLAPQPLAGLRAALAGDGYLAPAAAGGAVVLGATYEMALPGEDAPAEADPARAHEGNLARLQRLLAAPPPVQVTGVFSGLRCVAHDRLPLAGPVPDVAAAADRASELRGAHLPDLPRVPGLYCLTALGSRGLTLAPLLAELIAAQAEGAPWPVERDLAAAVDPARFLLQRLRRGRGAAG
jgi:tRNA 5-methylaminomethyl-2-thiouridine biosynthesis bifunctional protein